MSAQIGLEQIFQTLDKLRPDELWLVEEHIASLKKRNRRSFPPETRFDDETFLMPYEDYLALSEAARDNILSYAYNQYGGWIYEELARHFAKWMIVCGGKIVEWSHRLHDHPSHEKLNAIGTQTGYTPFVFCFPNSEGDYLTYEKQKRLWKLENDANDETQ